MLLFDKANRISGLLDKEGRKEKRLYTVFSAVFFLTGSFSLWEFVYELSHMIGAIASRDPGYAEYELVRMLPATMFMLACLFCSISLHNAFIALNLRCRVKHWLFMGVFSVVIGLAIIIYIPVGIGKSMYFSLVEGFPTLLFPLDYMIAGGLLILYGIFAIAYSYKLKKKDTSLPFVVSRHPAVLRKIGKLIGILPFFVGSAGFAAAVYGLTVLDWSHGAVFFNVMLWLNFFAAFLMLFLYRTVFCELRPEGEDRIVCLKSLSVTFIVLNIVIFILYNVSVEMYNEAPNLNAFGLLPADYTSTTNVFPFIYGLNNILTPLAALLYSITAGRKKKA